MNALIELLRSSLTDCQVSVQCVLTLNQLVTARTLLHVWSFLPVHIQRHWSSEMLTFLKTTEFLNISLRPRHSVEFLEWCLQKGKGKLEISCKSVGAVGLTLWGLKRSGHLRLNVLPGHGRCITPEAGLVDCKRNRLRCVADLLTWWNQKRGYSSSSCGRVHQLDAHLRLRSTTHQ